MAGTAFPRTVLPRRATRPKAGTGLVSTAQSGKVQLRGTQRVGHSWTETWGPLQSGTANNELLIAQIDYFYHRQIQLAVDHRLQRTLLGAGGGPPLVNGASQTGGSLITDGWTPSLTVLKAGDIFTLAGI